MIYVFLWVKFSLTVLLRVKALTFRNSDTEACEQNNHLLRRVAHSTTFMSPKLYNVHAFTDLEIICKKNKRR